MAIDREDIKETFFLGMGELDAANFVNPTISLKKMVTSSNVSGSTAIPCLRESATDLIGNVKQHFKIIMISCNEYMK